MKKRTLLGLALLGAGGTWLASKRAASYGQLAEDLRSPRLRFRSPGFTAGLLRLAQRPTSAVVPTLSGVDVERREIPGPPSAPPVPVFIYRTPQTGPHSPAILYIHGGGYVVGTASNYHDEAAGYARELNVPVVSVDYRLAPGTPFPGPLDDCYAALAWMRAQVAELDIDPARIALVGVSAGGGLAATLAQRSTDQDAVPPVFQLLVYPMLDDRTVLREDHKGRGEFVWTPTSNRLGWTSYLGHAPTLAPLPKYAAAARREDLSGLPPAWIGVGSLDLFYEEDVAYARRLQEAGVPCELYETLGGYHAFNTFQAGSQSAKGFQASQMAALRRALGD